MLIFAIDDEPKMLKLLHKAIETAAPQSQIRDFALGTEAVHAVEEEKLRPDVVFSDIEMPGLDGLRLAERMKRLVPSVKIVYVSDSRQYAFDALQVHANGYILKPVRADRVLEELRCNVSEPEALPEKLEVRCFGYFEAFWQGKPLMFRRRKTKELLAYLIDREGAMCTMEELATTLWEDESDISALKHRTRQLISDLKNTLSAIGMEALLVRCSGRVAIDRDLMDCDYFRMLDGDMDVANSYDGSYMTQYSWAEMTEGRLHFRIAR